MPFPFNPVLGTLHNEHYTGPLDADDWRITQVYGCTGMSWEPPLGTCKHWHDGIDIANKRCGDPIRTVMRGTVKVDGRPSWAHGAIMVRVIHPAQGTTQYLTDYYHLQSEGVKVGQVLTDGQGIGKCGTSGLSTACHLHFVVKRRTWNATTKKWGAWVKVNPATYLTIAA